MEDIIEKAEELVGINQEVEVPVEVETPVVEEIIETHAMCKNCEGKGTVNGGYKICPACNGNCFA